MKSGNWIKRALLSLALVALVSQSVFAEKAIDFQFTEVNGKTLHLSDYRGKWVLVNFWAPWCPLCWAETATLNTLHKRRDFVVIGVGLDYGPEESTVRATAKHHDAFAADFHAADPHHGAVRPERPVRQLVGCDHAVAFLHPRQHFKLGRFEVLVRTHGP